MGRAQLLYWEPCLFFQAFGGCLWANRYSYSPLPWPGGRTVGAGWLAVGLVLAITESHHTQKPNNLRNNMRSDAFGVSPPMQHEAS